MSKEAMKLALEAAYLAGFNDSAEGYNGEYPFRDHGATPTKDRHWVERRDAHIREALAEQPAQRKPLTDEQIRNIWSNGDCFEEIAFARAIEAAHSIKGDA
jgi:hypothetical protein